jgi:DNA repair protein RecN (Recombination protein N)
LQKKHQVDTVSELLVVKDTISQKLNAILLGDEEIERLRSEENRLHHQLIDMARELSDKRNDIIPALELKIQQILMEVGMPNAILQIKNVVQPDGQLNRMGLDLVQFLFSANKGQVPLPMSKVASGGELSRLMLSIKSLLAHYTALPTIIFDEIDTGISGEVALKVGTIMEKLAENMQVIAITHLPQIASKGKAHYCVYKDEQHDNTRTNIKRLDEQMRVVEIAQMLSGENPGAYALQNARELLSI